MIAVAHHVKVAVAEHIETLAEDLRIKELVLAEHIDGFVGDNRPGKKQLVPRFGPQLVHGFGRGDVVGLDLMSLVRNDQVGVPNQQILLQPPG